jgi:Zn finger protein HypA/HybF involved in hydrogenase expression
VSYSDTARILGPGTRLDPDAFAPKPPAKKFECLMCEAPMADKRKQWECPRCSFFYRPLVPGTIPKRYSGTLIKRMCTDCHRRQISSNPKQIYCETCNTKRRNASRRMVNSSNKHDETRQNLGVLPHAG